MKEKKPFYKKWWFWVIIVIVVIAIIVPDKGDTTVTDSVSSEASVTNSISTEVASEDPEEVLKDRLNLSFMGKVNGDTTGRWKLAEYVSAETAETIAVEYYNAFFEADDEIHWVINFGTHTTARISKLTDDHLDVYITEYVEHEETDAKEIGSGLKLKEYLVTISTGEIEDISEDE